jgi:hypothetical protein
MQVAETFTFPVPVEELPAPTKARLLELLPAAAAAKARRHEDCLPCQQKPQKPAGGHNDDDKETQPAAPATKGDAGGAEAALCELHLGDFVRLDTCVTVVDAAVFLDNLQSIEELKHR